MKEDFFPLDDWLVPPILFCYLVAMFSATETKYRNFTGKNIILKQIDP